MTERDIQQVPGLRRPTHEVCVGGVGIGGSNPVRVQSMTDTSTMDTEACVQQILRIVEAGGEIVRLTTQGTREAENLAAIRQCLRGLGCNVPLVADVHFNPAVADVAAAIVEGVRINPGNYVDAARKFKQIDYTDEEYAAEVARIANRLVPLLRLCKEHGTALRIGVNHGSLSDRIMSRYGDTPEGIVESCMEFLHVCRAEAFGNVVISIKASDPAVMVRSVRMLVDRMDAEDMHYPLHLGVTEAGEGEDGRIKSAVGIGALLYDGLGDTIRVSLSEAPECEIPVASRLVEIVASRHDALPAECGRLLQQACSESSHRRATHAVGNIGGQSVPVIISDMPSATAGEVPVADYIYTGGTMQQIPGYKGRYIVDYPAWQASDEACPAFTVQRLSEVDECEADQMFLFLPCSALTSEVVDILRRHSEIIVVAQPTSRNRVGDIRNMLHEMTRLGLTHPVVIFQAYCLSSDDLDDFRLMSSVDCGALLFDGLCDGLYLSVETLVDSRPLALADIERTAFGILQAAGLRRTRTEYVSCPGCGRTLYDLQGAIARIREATSGLPSLKLAVMGCIVNGPGEMAGADYGYVGAARGHISLYRGKECVVKNIPESEAVDRLLQLLREDGMLPQDSQAVPQPAVPDGGQGSE